MTPFVLLSTQITLSMYDEPPRPPMPAWCCVHIPKGTASNAPVTGSEGISASRRQRSSYSPDAHGSSPSTSPSVSSSCCQPIRWPAPLYRYRPTMLDVSVSQLVMPREAIATRRPKTS
jgi:hypothetical protein